MTGVMSEADRAVARDAWVQAVEALTANVAEWCKAKNWPTRRIMRKIHDTQLGVHEVPAILIQIGLAQLLLEPVSPRVPGSEGLIDLYAMPRYDDIASIYRQANGWRIHAGRDWTGNGDLTSGPGQPFGRDVFLSVASQMAHDAEQRPL